MSHTKKYRIGYVDEQKEQVITYKRRLRNTIFEVVGYDIKDGLSLEELMEQVYKSDIDLLMIDYKLNETGTVTFNGDEVAKDIYDKKPQFPHIIFTSRREDAEDYVDDWKLIYDKSILIDEEDEDLTEDDIHKKERFLRVLEKSIEQYKSRINYKKTTLANLLEKGEKKGLNTVEKSDIIKLQFELRNLDKTTIDEIPESLLKEEKIEKLSKARKDAEAFLQSLINKKKDQ